VKIRCLNARCKAVFSIKHSKCPKCNKDAGPIDFVTHHIAKRWYKLWGGKKRVFTTECPACKQPFRLDATECASCHTSVALFPLFLNAARPYLKLIEKIKWKLENLSRAQKFLISVSYFLASIFLIIALINRIETEIDKGNIAKIGVAALGSVFYIAVSLLVFSWIVPKNIAELASRLKAIYKVSLFINYLSFVLLLVIATDHWSTKAWILIGTFLISIVGIWFSGGFVIPACMNATAILSGSYATPQPDPNHRGRNSNHRPNRLA
jgi:hypothetical protein